MGKYLPVATLVLIDALLIVIATYAALRGYDVMFRNEPSPATIIWSAKIAMLWRLGVGLYVAAMLSVPLTILVARDLAKAVRATAFAVPLVGAMIALQGAFFP